MPGLLYRLRIRNGSTAANPDGTADALVLTSQRGGTNPYIVAAPEGDGAEVDPLTGAVRTGAYQIEVADPVTGESGGEPVRVVTSALEDAGARQHLLSRRAYIETSATGASWAVLFAGYVVGIRLVTASSYAITVGDTRRIETRRRVFTWSDVPGPTGVSERDRFPGRGCLLGGPVIGGFGPSRDQGGDEYVVDGAAQDSGVDPARKYLALTFGAGYLPPDYSRTRDAIRYAKYVRRVMEPFAEPIPSSVNIAAWPEPLRRLMFDYIYHFPKLAVRITAGGSSWTGTLRLAAPGRLVVLLSAASSGSPPSSGTVVRVRVFQSEVSEASPIYADLHPVDLVTHLLDTVGIPWDSTTAATVRAALGAELRYALRITKPEEMLTFLTEAVFGPFGFSIRNDPATGRMEFFLTRDLPTAAPAFTLTAADLRTDRPVAFALSEGSAVSSYRITYPVLARTTGKPEDSPPPPPDGIVSSEHTVTSENGDLTVFATREVAYTFRGMVHLASSWSPAMSDLVSAIARAGFDRFGRGAPGAEFAVLGTAAAAAAKLGQEILVEAPQYPNRNRRVGEAPSVGGRVMQVVRRTETPEGPEFKLLDVGLNSQPASPVPTLSVATLAAAPRTVGTFTITNAATINAGGVLSVVVEWAIASSTPSGSGALVARYAPGAVPTGPVSLPAAVPGSRLYVRARAEQVGRRASAWSSWATVLLSAFPAPSGVSLSAVTAESLLATFTPESDAFPVEVYIAPGSSAPADWTPYRVASLPGGSSRAVIRGLLASTAYIVGVAHRDPATGERSTVATGTTTTAGSSSTGAPVPIALVPLPGVEDAALDTGVALALYAADDAYDIEIHRADDVSGAPGPFSLLARVPGSTEIYRDPLPATTAVYWYRIRHALPGFTASAFTGAVSATARGLLPEIPRPILTAALFITVTPGDPDYTIAWAGVGTVTVSINGGAYGTPAASPITVTRTSTVQTYRFRAVLGGTTVYSDVEVPVSSATPPTLTSASASTDTTIACGVNWKVAVTWVTANPNDTDYKVRIVRYGTSTVVADDLSTAGGTFIEDTGETGDPAGSGTPHSRRYTAQMVRLSDMAVTDSEDTAEVSVETGPAC